MARRQFGGSSADTVIDQAGNIRAAVSGTFRDPDTLAAVTDLLVGGSPATSVTTDNSGMWLAQGPDAINRLQVSFAGGPWTLVLPTDGAGAGGVDQEAVEDILGSKIAAGENITVSYNDTTGVTTISAPSAGLGPSRLVPSAGTTRPTMGATDVWITSSTTDPSAAMLDGDYWAREV